MHICTHARTRTHVRAHTHIRTRTHDTLTHTRQAAAAKGGMLFEKSALEQRNKQHALKSSLAHQDGADAAAAVGGGSGEQVKASTAAVSAVSK